MRHHRLRYQRARIDEMRDLPAVGVLLADPCQVRAGALGAPQHRMIVLQLHRQRIGAVAVDLVAQGSDHLAVAGVTPFANVDVAPGLLQRRVDAHVRRGLDRFVDGEQRRDLDRASHHGGGDDPERQPQRVALEPVVGGGMGLEEPGEGGEELAEHAPTPPPARPVPTPRTRSDSRASPPRTAPGGWSSGRCTSPRRRR